MNEPLDRLEDALRVWASDAGCRLVVLFGSWAEDGLGPPRDVDVALDLGPLPTPERRLDILRELQDLTAPLSADVVFLHAGTSPVLRFEIFRGGKPVFEREPGLFVAETVRAMGQYEDAIPFRRARERRVLEGRGS